MERERKRFNAANRYYEMMEESLTFNDMELLAMRQAQQITIVVRMMKKPWIIIDYISYLLKREASFRAHDDVRPEIKMLLTRLCERLVVVWERLERESLTKWREFGKILAGSENL